MEISIRACKHKKQKKTLTRSLLNISMLTLLFQACIHARISIQQRAPQCLSLRMLLVQAHLLSTQYGVKVPYYFTRFSVQ